MSSLGDGVLLWLSIGGLVACLVLIAVFQLLQAIWNSGLHASLKWVFSIAAVVGSGSVAFVSTIEHCAKIGLCPEKPPVVNVTMQTPPLVNKEVHTVERVIERIITAPVPLQREARSDPAMQRAANTSGQVAIATLTAPPAHRKSASDSRKAIAPAEPSSEQRAELQVALAIRAELVRLQCLEGAADQAWGRNVERAIDKFNTFGHRRIARVPEPESIGVLQGFKQPVCRQ